MHVLQVFQRKATWRIVLATCLATNAFWVGLPALVGAAPLLTIEPSRGHCGFDSPPISLRGSGFSPGDALSLIEFDASTGIKQLGVVNLDPVPANGVLVVSWQVYGCGPQSSEGQQYIFAFFRAGSPSQSLSDALATATFTASVGPAPLPEGARQCFVETQHCIQGRFLAYWQMSLYYSQDNHNPWHGDSGLTRHGYPLTDERMERLDDGNMHLVQYFERTRLEYHPENAPPYDVLIGHVGRQSRPVDPPASALPPLSPNELSDPVYYPATGHNLQGRFRVYWTLHGGLTQFGLPISEEFEERVEGGDLYRVQYFERARLEYHPEANTVFIGLLGRDILVAAK